MGDSLFNILEAESGIIITSNGPVIVLYPTISESSPEQDSGNILKYVKENERHKTINMKRRKKKKLPLYMPKIHWFSTLECLAPLSITKSDSLRLFRKALKNSMLNCYIN